MQIQTSPLILSIGAADPVGAIGIQADLAVFGALGCHGLSVTTVLLIGDTTGVDDVQPVDPDWVADQARVLLEDMPVMAIKIGALGGLEQVSAIAEIISDYPEVALILDPFISALPEQGLEDEDMLTAVRQLLVPQATVLVLSPDELDRLAETWREPVAEDRTEADINFLLELGCKYVLLSNTRADGGRPGQRANSLYGADGLLLHTPWQRLDGSFSGAGSTLSAALAANLAHEALYDAVLAETLRNDYEPDDDKLLEGGTTARRLKQALQEAQTYTSGALAEAQRFGMGRLVPHHHYKPRRAG